MREWNRIVDAPAAAGSAGAVPVPDRSPGRLAWLDGLRGIAALAVFADHLTYSTLVGAKRTLFAYFYPGWFGVALFFLVSGYIIPASLDRRGSLRGFWLGRIFRLYPLWAVAVGAFVLLAGTNLVDVGGYRTDHPHRTALIHLTMLQSLAGEEEVLQVLWTLSFEMVFYLLVSALFVAGWHRRAGLWALVLIGGAVGLGFVATPWSSLVHAHPRLAGNGTAVAFVLAVAGLLSGLRWAVLAGAVTAAGLSVALLATSELLGDWRNLGVLALMFTGTVLHRAERGLVSWWRAGALAVTVVVLLAAVMTVPPGQWFAAGGAQPRWAWATATLASGALFGAGLLLRNRWAPTTAAWLGRISYSVYLLHPVLILVMLAVVPAPSGLPLAVQVLLAAGLLAVLLGVSHLTYRWVEVPFQRWGRTVTKLADRRLGSDVRTAHGRPVVAPAPADSHAAP